MSLNALVRLPLSSSKLHDEAPVRHSLFSSQRQNPITHPQLQNRRHMLVVEAKGKKGMMARQYQRTPPPPLPKLEDDGNPKFVIFIRMANVFFIHFLHFSLS